MRDFSAAEGDRLRDWEQLEYNATNSIRTLSWCYLKNGTTSMAEDSGWLDALSFTVPVQLSKTQICTALDLSADNCSQIRSVSADPPSFPWRVTMDTSVAGGSSLRSAPIDDNQQSCLVLGLSLPRNSVITLASRTSSQGGFDQLQFSLEQLRLDTLSAAIGSTEKPWGNTIYYYDQPLADVRTLRWCYVKDSADSSDEDSVWIDNLSFGASGTAFSNRFCTVLDLPEAICSIPFLISYTPGILSWTITSQTSVLGGTSLRSADIGDDGQTCLRLSFFDPPLPADTVIRFSVRIDSEAVNDFLFLSARVDRLLDNFSATNGSLRDWETFAFRLTRSIQNLHWCYTKNSSTSIGADSIWLDDVSITLPLSINDVCQALDLSTDNCSQVQSVSADPPSFPWRVTMETSVAGGSSLRSAPVDDNQQSCLVLGLSLPRNSVITLASRTSSQGGFDQLQFSLEQLRLDTLSAAIGSTEKPWGNTIYYYDQPLADVRTLRWCYVKDSADSDGEDRVWIDDLSFGASGTTYPNRTCTVLDLPEAICSIPFLISYTPGILSWTITSQTSVLGGLPCAVPISETMAKPVCK